MADRINGQCHVFSTLRLSLVYFLAILFKAFLVLSLLKGGLTSLSVNFAITGPILNAKSILNFTTSTNATELFTVNSSTSSSDAAI